VKKSNNKDIKIIKLEELTWKKIEIIDSVIGPYEPALELFAAGKLHPGTILFKRTTQRMQRKKS